MEKKNWVIDKKNPNIAYAGYLQFYKDITEEEVKILCENFNKTEIEDKEDKWVYHEDFGGPSDEEFDAWLKYWDTH